jgi:adenine-specific DNA-methyltransferase
LIPHRNSEHLIHQLLEGDAAELLDQIDDASCRLAVTSPPYNIGKAYEKDDRRSLDDYIQWLSRVLLRTGEKVASDGHLCLQVGNYVHDGEVFPIDSLVYPIVREAGWHLRNRIVWHFNFGLHANRRLSGRYETLLWFTKSADYHFNLDAIRVPQLYPGKRHAASKGAKAGTPSGNPAGKNPSDYWTFDPHDAFLAHPIWDIPNVKSKHPEKTVHPAQFPSELVERCVLALTRPGDTILDPFVGTGTTVIAAARHGRVGVGFDRDPQYIAIAKDRLKSFQDGSLVLRDLGRPVRKPVSGEKVATTPDEWKTEAAE